MSTLSQTQMSCGTSSWQKWRWARAASGNGRAAKRPRANLPPFHPTPRPLTPETAPCIHRPHADSWQQRSPQTGTDPVTRDTYQTLSATWPIFLLLHCFFIILLPQVLWCPPPEAVEQRRCIILIRNRRNEKSLKAQVKAHFKMHFFLLLSLFLPALFVFVNFGTLRRTWGVERWPPLPEEDRLEEEFLWGVQSIVLPAPTDY